MARTNKMWILKQKTQQQKQKKLMVWWSWVAENIWEKRDYTNEKWNTYKRFFRTWKYVCDVTSCREDPDWFRAIRKPNSWEIFWKYTWKDSYWFRRWFKKSRRQ